MRAWQVARRLGATLVVLASLGAGLVVFGPRADTPAPAAARAVVGSAPSTVAPTSPPPSTDAPVAASLVPAPTAPPALSTPEPPPSDPYAPVPIVPVADLSIPRIGLERTVNEGVWLTVIDQGPAHWPGTAAPGGWGNVVIAAHRTVQGGPFLRIGELMPGDEIVLRDAAGTHVYAVTGSEVVTPKDLWIVDQHPGRTITLFSCHPIGSASHRLVVRGTLVSSTPPARSSEAREP